MAKRKGISTGSTNERSIEEQGHLRFNTTTNLLEYYDGTAWKSIDAPPAVSSISPSDVLSGDSTGNYTIVVTGSGFSTSVTAKIITDGGVEISPDTTTRDSATQVTLVVAKNTANLTNANEPFDIKIVNSSGLAGTLADALTIDGQPVFSTSAGSLYSASSGSWSDITIAAADPESGGDITYTLESGSLPAGLSGTSTSSGYVISGTPTEPVSNTTSNFTIRATDVNSNTSDRAFSITITAIVVESFTSSGTFSVPAGVTSVDVLVVAGGGSGGGSNTNAVAGGGGGAGGLIFRPAFPVTPGGTVSVTVGSGGQGFVGADTSHPGPTNLGQDSVFGTLTAKGGGGGGAGSVTSPDHPDGYAGNKGLNGGSGGGTAGWGSGDTPAAPQPSGTQPTQPGDSGTYGFGNSGATGGNPGTPSGSGGGAGAAGNNGGPGPSRAGGIGKAYNISGTSTYYAGGGGSGGQNAIAGNDGSPGPGGQGGGAASGTMGSGGSNGEANRGGGGGGCGASQGNVIGGGNGGKGIVIVKY